MQLFIHSFGAKLAVRDGIFEITTIEGKQYVKHDYAPTELESIWIQRGCSMTSAAVLLAVENNIDLLLLDGLGKPVGRFMPIVPNSIVTIQRAQILAANQPLGLEIVKDWIAQKMLNQANLLTQCVEHHRSKSKDNQEVRHKIAQIMTFREQLLSVQAEHIGVVADSIRGIEGSAGRAYFSSLTQILPERYDFKKRSYQQSTDFFNTCLNYGYAILYSKVETALIKAGLNPYIGFMHADGSLQRSLVYDFVEPYRAWVDEKAINLVASKTMSQSLFEEQASGALWFSHEGKRIFADSLLNMLQEPIAYMENLNVSRERFLLLKAQNLASQLLDNQRGKVIESDLVTYALAA
jgi:CRISP-associated protein Cas1